MVKLYFQDPRYEYSYSLHEALLDAISKSIKGGGTYAFVTAGGIKLLLEDKVFSTFLENKKFELIVGMDEITNSLSINKLLELKEKHSGKLEIKAFIHKDKNSLFHPKFSWFKTSDEKGILVLGSGNLTESGLRRNREVFNVINLDKDQIKEIEEEWNKWLNQNTNNLKEIEEEEVMFKAIENRIVYRSTKENKKDTISKRTEVVREIVENPQEDDFDIIELEAWEINENETTNQLYIGEVPRSSDRWNQINFSKDIFENYFGAKNQEEKEYRIIFRNINSLGELKDTEVRPCVKVKSKNYRFELDAAKGKPYPDSGDRPILISIKVATRMFLYSLLMPCEANYQEVKKFLYRESTITRKDRMKYYTGQIAEFRELGGNLPIFNYVKGE